MTDLTTIPFNKLVPADDNVRKTGKGDGIDELAASIAAHGLLQSLVVRKAKRGKYAVVAGNRRLSALKALAESGVVGYGFEVPCRLLTDEDDATEIGLAENVVRMPMHPADQFEAFRDVIDKGASVADVAARFGVSDGIVAKRLRLGRLSPVILDAYRQGAIGLDEAQAFAITDDQDAQERVWSQLPDWNRNPRIIRQALTEDEIPASDKRVRFAGLDVYEDRGGAVRRDLFDEHGVYLLDETLLDELVHAGLEREAESVREEGWAWVEIVPDLDRESLSEFSRRYPEQAPLSDEDDAELERLSEEYDTLVEQLDDDVEDPDLEERLSAIDARIDELNDSSYVYPDETKAIAGTVLTLNWQGAVDVIRGLVRPEDEPAKPKPKSGSDPAGDPAVVLPANLVEDLTGEKTMALRAAVAGNTDVALAALVHALASQVFFPATHGEICLQITVRQERLARPGTDTEQSPARVALDAKRERWQSALPVSPDELWSWCLEQSRDVLLDLLAFCVGLGVDAVRRKHDAQHSPRLLHADALARALSLNMADWYMPTAESFFARISAASIHAALSEARGQPGAPAWSKLKKAELAALAERLIGPTGWQPEPLRIGDGSTGEVDGTDSGTFAEAAE